jgi:phosphinothricin acetyltransferase
MAWIAPRQKIIKGGAPWRDKGRRCRVCVCRPFHTRRRISSLEDSIYVHRDRQDKASGFFSSLIEACRSRLQKIVALIGDSGNIGSIRIHERAIPAPGVLKSVGIKQDRWIDVVLMQLTSGLVTLTNFLQEIRQRRRVTPLLPPSCR